jgi:hypothetical protein
VARERQIAGIIGAGVLLRDDVLDVMFQFAVNLTQAAVFASLPCPAADEIPRGLIHPLLESRVKLLPGLQLEDRNEVRCIDQRFILGAFGIAQSAFVSPFRKRVDPFLHGRFDPQFHDPARRLRIETPAQRLQ